MQINSHSGGHKLRLLLGQKRKAVDTHIIRVKKKIYVAAVLSLIEDVRLDMESVSIGGLHSPFG